MQGVEEILKKELEGKAFEVAVIPAKDIPFTDELIKACESNRCGRYKKSWMCPPAVGQVAELEKKYKSYKYALVFTTKGELEDSFDIEGIERARRRHLEIERQAVEKVRGLGAEWLSAGSCDLCSECTYPDAPCRFPDLARPSPEACGIDVTALAKVCNMRYYNGINTVTFFSVIFFN